MKVNSEYLLDEETGQRSIATRGTGSTDSKGNLIGVTALRNDGEASQPHNRFIDTVGNTQALMGHMTWTENEDVTAIRFRIDGGTPGEIMKVVFDATPVDDITDDNQAWAWLQAATSDPAIDVEYFELVHGGVDTTNNLYVPDWTDWFEFGGALRRADFLAAGTGRTIFAEVG